MVVILLGPPAAGKGTQAENITTFLDVPHISTGEILRKNIKEKTPLGITADGFISKGDLVPDDLIIALIRDRVMDADCKKGYLLDGFPRTLKQAEALGEFAKIDRVIDLSVSRQTLLLRVTGRRVCTACGKNYHVSNYGDSLCVCGGQLFVRDDDKQETFAARLDNYDRLTAPLKDYYLRQGKLARVDGEGSAAEVFERVKEALKN